MRVRILELRLLAGTLCALWILVGIVVAVAYHPGGPADRLVVILAFLPAAVATSALVWPPLVRGDRASAAVGWLGLISALLLVPSLLQLMANLAAGPRQPLLPSPEVAYAAALALATTCLFAGLGIFRGVVGQTDLRPRRFVAALGLGLILTTTVAGALGGAALANDAVLRERPPSSSRYGPTDGRAVPPLCRAPIALGEAARVELSASSSVDLRPNGSIELRGARSGTDEAWQGRFRSLRRSLVLEYHQVAGAVTVRRDEGPAQRVRGPVSFLGAAPTLDGAVATALDEGARSVAEDQGMELVGGARARHCRASVDGTTALNAFPSLRWLAGLDPLRRARTLDDWRGDLDYWVFEDGRLGMAVVTVSGPPPEPWPDEPGLQAVFQARLSAVDRTQPVEIGPPPGTEAP